MGSASVEDVLSSAEAGGRVIRGSIWRVLGSVAGIAAGLGTAALLLRHLGVTEAGRYVTVMSLAAIASSVLDIGLNVTASRELALCEPDRRGVLMGNVIGQRIWTAPIAIALLVGFAAVAGYPADMRTGTAIAAAGVCVMAVADGLLLPLTVQLRNAGLAFVDFLKQAVTLVGVAALVALGAHLVAFFSVLALAAVCVLVAAPYLCGREAFRRPRLDRATQRMLLVHAMPVAAALVLGQLYFRLVILLMSLISSSTQTGWFAGSLRATEALLGIPILVAGVALPMLAAAARDDRGRLRYAIGGLTEGALFAGALVVIVSVRAATPAMRLIGGPGFAPAGSVLRIQVCALLFAALTQLWAVSLIALGRRRDLIATNALGLAGVAVFAAALVPAFGARGGAAASVLGDALLASLTWWRLRAHGVSVTVRPRFLPRLLAAAAAGCAAIALPGLPDVAAATFAGIAFLAVAQAVGAVPSELRQALRR